MVSPGFAGLLSESAVAKSNGLSLLPSPSGRPSGETKNSLASALHTEHNEIKHEPKKVHNVNIII
jgi:hypothetical protein